MENNENSSSCSYTEEDELFNYIASQDEKKVNDFLKRKKLRVYEFRNKDGKNSSLLHTSVYKKNYNIVKSLIDYCKLNFPDHLVKFVNGENSKGICPIHYASFGGNLDIIKLLIENGADITKKTEKNLNIIHYCAQGNSPNSLMYFFFQFNDSNMRKKEKYKLIFEKDSADSTVLHWAVYAAAEDFILYLFNLDIFDSEQDKLDFLNMQDKNGFTALHLSITSRSSRIATKLLQYGANIDLTDNKNRTALNLAIEKGQDELRDLLEDSKKCQYFRLKAPLKQIKRNNKNIIAIFACQIFCLFIIFFSTVPINFYKYQENEYMNILFYIFIFLLIVFIFFYISLLIIDPGVRRRRSLEELKSLLKNKVDLTKYCYKCFVLKTKTSKHCIICDCCYNNFDHHCYWINKCVAKNNFILFIIFLFITSLYLLNVLILCIFGLININIFNSENFDINNFCKKHYLLKSLKSNDFCTFLYNDKFAVHLVLNIILMLTVLIFLIPECFILFLHINIIFSNYREGKLNKALNIKSRISSSPLMDESRDSLTVSKNT